MEPERKQTEQIWRIQMIALVIFACLASSITLLVMHFIDPKNAPLHEVFIDIGVLWIAFPVFTIVAYLVLRKYMEHRLGRTS